MGFRDRSFRKDRKAPTRSEPLVMRAFLSLQINKSISSGEGGMVVTRDPELHRRIEALHNAGYAPHPQTPKDWYGDVPVGWGHGRRMSELQAAVARVQLRRLDFDSGFHAIKSRSSGISPSISWTPDTGAG